MAVAYSAWDFCVTEIFGRHLPDRCRSDGRSIEGQGFIDTGNRLYDNLTGLPVVVIGIKTLMPYLNDEEISLLFTGHVENVFKNARKMSCKSVGGDSSIWLIEPEQFEVYSKDGENILYEVIIGLSFSSLSGEENYNAILPPAITEVN